jgi:ribosomal protein S18 acetylase RimI-like enzyme
VSRAEVEIRPFAESDWAQLWPVMAEVARAQETYAYEPDMTAEQGHAAWVLPEPGETFVAVEGGRVLGSAKTGPNRPGPGAHVSTASFLVAADARGRGVGTALCRFVLDRARERGYAGMQFNAVVETNRAAVAVYERLGFTIVGTVPGAYEHATAGRVGLHVMYCPL